MKIIDLLNKIANGEEVPKKIIYKGSVWYLEQDFSNRLPYYKNGYNMDNLLTGEEKDYFSQSLNDEVGIIEEEKKIPGKWNDLSFTTMRKKEDSIDDDIHKLKGYIETIMRTQNEIIDYLKSKGE